MQRASFHQGELQAQALAGFSEVGGNIYSAMPDQHREFFAGLRYVFVGTLDDEQWPVATVFSGPPGFMRTPDAGHLRISARRWEEDPAQAALVPGQSVGLLGLDFSNRRRNRANGVISRTDKNRIEIAVNQSFGNCPKYIQVRDLSAVEPGPVTIERLAHLDVAARELISHADTCFIASSSQAELAQGGVDISHRGGRPGFVYLAGNTLWIPDFRGNRYMNTLGNLLIQPRAAMLFIDFERGDVLHLQGTTQVLWQQSPDNQWVEGAERYWRFDIERAWRFVNAFPLRAQNVDYSPHTLATGLWTPA
ncbi:pyridoxamine 5'-phosphate oxidase family protein [Rouxiella sp. Mn2063]|uniref:pyridoxamine 5'-phosphate oxidase family protein n=1 Tax=Rouxiella sp. Mn2063 TaxID=3395262 RepID=UPI003BBF8397